MADIAVPAPRKPRRPDVRFFEKPEITLYRMGREVAKLTGEHGSIDLRTGTVHVFAGRVTAEGPAVEAPRIALHLGVNQIVADGGAGTWGRGARGGVRRDEGGIAMTADRAIAPPSLIGLVPAGRVTLLAKDRDAADAILTSRLL